MADDLSACIVEALDQSGQIALVLDVPGAAPEALRLAWANRSWCLLFGDHLGAPAFLDPPQNRPALDQAIAVAQAGAGMARVELLAPSTAGITLTLGVQFVPLADQAPPRLLMIGRDITDARRRAATEAATQWLLAQVFRCVDTPVVITRADGRVAMVNPRLLTLLGRRPGELEGHPLGNHVHPDDQAAVAAMRAATDLDLAQHAVTVRLATGTGTWVATRQLVQRVEHGEQNFRIVTIHPVSHAAEPPLANESITVAGKLRLLGLEDVRDSLGDRWPALAERAMATAERVLARNLLDGESFSRTQDGGFVVCLTTAAGPEEAAFRAAMLAREIRRKLLGEAEDPRLATVSAVTEPTPLPPEEAAAGAATLAHRLETRLATVRLAAESRARDALRTAVDAGECERVPVLGPDGAPVPIELIELKPATRRALATAAAVLPPAETEHLDPTLLRLGLAAEPILTSASSDAALLPIEFEALAHRARADRALAQLRELAAARGRLVPLLTEIPDGASKLRVGDMLRMLRGFGRAVAVELDEIDDPPFDLAGKLATLAVVPALRLLGQERRRPGSVLAAARRLQAHGVRVLALGANAAEARTLARLDIRLHTPG